MGWWGAYVALLLALVVRVSSGDAPRRAVPEPAPGEPVRVIAMHHGVFFLLLFVLAPGEALLRGGAAGGRWVGLGLFALGVGAYRAAGRSLGEALSPFVEPAPGAALVTGGIYRRIRHPMYLGQGMIAVGAPLTLGVRWALAASTVALIVLAVRVRLEEAALRRRYAEYPRYAEGTKRFVPYLF